MVVTRARHRPPLLTLPAELLWIVLELACEASPRTLRALGLTNKEIYLAAAPILHKHKTISFTPTNASGVPAGWFDNDAILAHTRHLRIQNRRTPDQHRDRRPGGEPLPNDPELHADFDFARLALFVARLRRLDSLIWAPCIQFPVELLDAVHTHPRARLSIECFTRPVWCAGLDPAEDALAASPALRAIGTADMDQASPIDLRREALFRILALASNLHRVTLGPERGMGYSIGAVLDARAVDKKRKIRMLQDGVARSESVRELRALSWRVELQHLARKIDLRRLERMVCSSGVFAADENVEATAATFSGLKDLTVMVPHVGHRMEGDPLFRADLTAFLMACRRLEALNVRTWDLGIDIPPIIGRHGNTLRRLEIHMAEDVDYLRDVISSVDVKLICDSCPNLRDLGIDINRTSDKPRISNDRITFRNLAGMVSLEHLQLHLDLGLSRRSPPTPKANDIELYCIEVWNHCFAKVGPTQKRELVICVGEVERLHLIRRPSAAGVAKSFEKNACSKWTLNWDDRDDRVGEVSLETSIKSYEWYDDYLAIQRSRTGRNFHNYNERVQESDSGDSGDDYYTSLSQEFDH